MLKESYYVNTLQDKNKDKPQHLYDLFYDLWNGVNTFTWSYIKNKHFFAILILVFWYLSLKKQEVN